MLLIRMQERLEKKKHKVKFVSGARWADREAATHEVCSMKHHGLALLLGNPVQKIGKLLLATLNVSDRIFIYLSHSLMLMELLKNVCL